MDSPHYAPEAFHHLAHEARMAGRLTEAVRFEGVALLCGRLFAHLPRRGILGVFEQLATQEGPVGARARETVRVLRQRYDDDASGECFPAVSTMFALTARAFVRVLREGDLSHTQRVDVAQVMDDLLADATTLAMGQDFGPRDVVALSAHELPSLAISTSDDAPVL